MVKAVMQKGETMSDLISRQAVLESLKTDYSLIMFDSYGNLTFTGERIIEAIKRVPSVEPERVKGKWEEQTVIHKEDAVDVIEAWQEARCNKCGLYHTTPYLYFFRKYEYCPHCGAEMEVDG